MKDETDLAVNREILAALLRSDIEIKGDYNPKIFHQKFVLRDYEGKATATSALLSGSANFTWTDTHVNLNNVFIFRNAYICRQYLTEVEQLKRGSFGRDAEDDWHRVMVDGESRVAVQLAPNHVPPDWPEGTPEQQIHLDLWVEDFAEAHDRVMSLGARVLRPPAADDNFQVYGVPAGHPFCLCWVQ